MADEELFVPPFPIRMEEEEESPQSEPRYIGFMPSTRGHEPIEASTPKSQTSTIETFTVGENTNSGIKINFKHLSGF